MGSESLKNQKVVERVNFKMIHPYKDHREDREAVEAAKAAREKRQADAAKFGSALARKVFEARGNNSEIHLSEAQLAALLGVAHEDGLKR